MVQSLHSRLRILNREEDHYIDRVAVDCVNQLAPKWSSKLAAFDVYIWDQCYSMEQTLRIE
jgi:hypothetical protein